MTFAGPSIVEPARGRRIEAPLPLRFELADGHFLERYLGWRVLLSRPRVKLLERRRGGLGTLLLLVDGASPGEIADVARAHHLRRPGITLHVQDFSGGETAVERALGDRLQEVRDDRMFGAGTFVFDLDESEEALWERIAIGKQREIRRAERKGLRCDCSRTPESSVVERFLAFQRSGAGPSGGRRIDPGILFRMLTDRTALFAVAYGTTPAPLAIDLVHVEREHALHLASASEEIVPEGTTHALAWHTMLHLKSLGRRWYDLGQVSSADPQDASFWFERSLGADFLPAGRELRRAPFLVEHGERLLERALAAARALS
jgi:hypothetical protein